MTASRADAASAPVAPARCASEASLALSEPFSTPCPHRRRSLAGVCGGDSCVGLPSSRPRFEDQIEGRLGRAAEAREAGGLHHAAQACFAGLGAEAEPD